MRASSRSADAEKSLAPPIRPWRSLLICAALVALALALLRDMGITDQRSLADALTGIKLRADALLADALQSAGAAPEQPDPTAPDAVQVDRPEPEAIPRIEGQPDAVALPPADTPVTAPSDSVTGGGTLLARVLGDPLRLTFAAGCVATLLFIAVQLINLGIDTRLVGRREPRSGVLTPFAHLVRALAARQLRLGNPRQRRVDALVLATEGDVIADPLRLGLTAFPMIGFLGTVVGLSGAIETLPDAIGNPDALRPVLTELHVAFDTTLIGLVGALICLVGARAIDGAWDRLSRHASLG